MPPKNATTPVLLPEGDPLVDRLARWRRERARERRVPAYRVLPNATLLALARERPRRLRDLLAVRGMGPARVEADGLALLRLLARAPRRRVASEPRRRRTR